MIGYILTQSQYEQIQGKHYTPYQCFNCVQDINDVWFTFFSEQQKEEIVNNPEWNWILTLPEAEYVPKPSPPFPPL
jgi:hypothetical protein